MIRNFKEKLTDIKAFAFDIDGVFTDSMLTILPSGEIIRNFNAKDGFAVMQAIKKGYKVAVISGGRGVQARQRMEELRIEHIYMESKSKIADLKSFMAKVGVELHEVLFVGDDYPDIVPMQAVGLSIAPSDAADAVRAIASYTSLFGGGRGVVRDAIEQVMRANGDWCDPSDGFEPL